MSEGSLSSSSGFVVVIVGCSVDLFHSELSKMKSQTCIIFSSLFTRDDENF